MADLLFLVKKRLQHAVANVKGDQIPEELRQVVRFILSCTISITTHDLPYPVAYRNQKILPILDEIAAHFHQVHVHLEKIKQERNLANAEYKLLRILTILAGEEIAANDRYANRVQDLAMHLLYREQQGTLIEVTDALDELLCASDLDANLPMALLAPPYVAQYVRFGKFTCQRLTGTHPYFGDIAPHGGFCVLYEEAGKRLVALHLHFVSIQKKEKFTYAIRSVIDDPDLSIQAWIEKLFIDRSLEDNDGRIPLVDQERILDCVAYMTKIFLYLGMKNARILKQPDYSELAARLARVGQKKQTKLERRLASAYDRIIVGPEFLPRELQATSGDLHAVSPHWRRGHFRMQPYGPGNAQRKLIFILPILVAVDRLAEQPSPLPKNYAVSPGWIKRNVQTP